MLLSLLWCVGCGPRWPAVTPFARPAPGATLPAPVVLAVLGGVDPPARGLVADLRERQVDVVIVAGDLVRESTPGSWLQARQRFDDLAVWGSIGAGEQRGDPSLRGPHAAWPEGTWGHLTVATEAGDVRWAILDHRAPLDQRFWLPGVLAEPLAGAVVVLGRPNDELQAATRAAAAPEDLCAVVTGGEGVNAWRLPDGPWGTAMVSAGAAGGPAAALAPDALTDAFAGSLREAFAEEVPAVEPVHARGEPFRPPAFATTGWWEVTVHPDASMTWSLRRRDASGAWGPVFRSRWSPAGGHQALEAP